MFRFRHGVAIASCLIFVVAAIAFASANRESYRPLRLTHVDGETRYTAVELAAAKLKHEPAKAKQESLGTTSFESLPRVNLLRRTVDFGTVDPQKTHRETIDVRNVGTAPLRVFDPGTSCKCLGVEIADETIAPGEVGQVSVTWNAHPTPLEFLQRVTIATNDPANSLLQLDVTGKVRVLVAASPEELIAGRILPDQSTSVSTVIVSGVWDKFEIEDVRSRFKGMEWSASPIPANRAAELGMKSGNRLNITLPPGSIDDAVDEGIIIRVRPTDGEGGPAEGEAIEREIPFHATVARRIAVYGEGVTPWGTIRLGQVDSNIGAERRLMVKVNDPERKLTLAESTADPAFVRATLVPHEQLKKPGYYQLLLEIPPTGSSGVYQGKHQGHLRLKFAHPRIKQLELGLEFVLGPGEQRIGQGSDRFAFGR